MSHVACVPHLLSSTEQVLQLSCPHHLEILKAQEKRDRVCACTDGSASLRTCTHLKLSWETLHFTPVFPIYHAPNKSFLSEQAYSAIPWISFAGFCQKSTQMYLCLSNMRALDMQMQYYGPSAARQVKQPALRLYQRACLSAQLPNHICLASGHLKANIPLLFIISTLTRSSFTSGPKLPGSADFWSWYCPWEDVCVLQPNLQALLWAISPSAASLGLFCKVNLHTIGLNSKSIASSPVKQDHISKKCLLGRL